VSISRKTPVEHLPDEHTGERAITSPPVSDVSVVERLTSDVAPARIARTEPPTLIALGQEELLRLAGSLPVEDGVEAVARAVAETIREAASPAAVAIVLRGEGDATIIPSVPFDLRDVELTASAEDGPPRRLFGSATDEWIVPLAAPFEGTSLHVADLSGRTRDPLRSRQLAELSERAALVLTSGLLAARRVASGRVDSAHLRALQARIVQSEKLASVGQIAAKVVHELNNPLTAIVTYSAFLTKKLERAGHEEADVERLRRIGESADRILRFSRELTTYARPNEETASLVSIQEVIERAVVFCEHVLMEHRIRVQTKVDPQTPPVVGRRGQLTQVFVNLVTNACHAIQDASRAEDGRIEIEISAAESGGVRVSVADNGNGISPEHVIRIFDPFFTTKTEGRGTGLGLSIVRSIVEAHGGRVWVRSVVGSGSSFIVELTKSHES
jgi:two-component system, NtrC family, sensor kinase